MCGRWTSKRQQRDSAYALIFRIFRFGAFRMTPRLSRQSCAMEAGYGIMHWREQTSNGFLVRGVRKISESALEHNGEDQRR